LSYVRFKENLGPVGLTIDTLDTYARAQMDYMRMGTVRTL